MSTLFNKVQKYYKMGLYTKAVVADFVAKGKLTAEEYKIITGDDYAG